MGLKPEQLAKMFGAVATPATALCLPAERSAIFRDLVDPFIVPGLLHQLTINEH
jgi:hypothetical protein